VNTTQHGHLLLADITGYTSYVATTELTHSQEILTELLECIIEKFKPLLTISKIEGDAVFAYAAESSIPRSETLLQLIDSTYIAFRSRKEAAHRRTTCTCNACRNIPNLDLKFIAHHGEYFVQSISGAKELVGSDVNLIHRLTKNSLSEKTGWRAYAMFTEQGLSHFAALLEGLTEQAESYEHLGKVRTFSMDMHARYKELMEARRVTITPQEAHYMYETDFDAPPPIVWEWFNDPHKRGQWMTSEIIPIWRIRGRSGAAGARNHCVHGKNQVVVEDVLDMRPYEYFTVSHTPQGTKATLLMTFRFEEKIDRKTHFTLTFKARVPLFPEWLNKQFCKLVLRIQVFKLWHMEAINGMINSNSETSSGSGRAERSDSGTEASTPLSKSSLVDDR
jgi:uncharacterized protein YndB with AHSA1/START domain